MLGPHRLEAAVRSAAEEITLRLDGDVARGSPLGEAGLHGVNAAVAVAAVRVLNADALAPCTLLGQRLDPADEALVTAALRCFPPGRNPSPVDEWLHWGLAQSMADAGGPGLLNDAQPAVDWVMDVPWPVLSHWLGQLAALARPGAVGGLVPAVHRRAEDLARGCVRALLRRDWPQAAGVCRWLALVGNPLPSLGLAAVLDHLDQMARDDPRTLLQVRIARMLGKRLGT